MNERNESSLPTEVVEPNGSGDEIRSSHEIRAGEKLLDERIKNPRELTGKEKHQIFRIKGLREEIDLLIQGGKDENKDLKEGRLKDEFDSMLSKIEGMKKNADELFNDERYEECEAALKELRKYMRTYYPTKDHTN